MSEFAICQGYLHCIRYSSCNHIRLLSIVWQGQTRWTEWALSMHRMYILLSNRRQTVGHKDTMSMILCRPFSIWVKKTYNRAYLSFTISFFFASIRITGAGRPLYFCKPLPRVRFCLSLYVTAYFSNFVSSFIYLSRYLSLPLNLQDSRIRHHGRSAIPI